MKQGWKIKKLGDICYPKKEIKRASTYCSSSDRITYIDISSIDAASNRIVAPNEMLFKDAPSRAQQMVMRHDVLVSLVRPNLKNIAMVHTAIDYLVASSGFCVLRTKENPYYIKYLVTGEKFTKYLMSRTSGANYPAVREDDIRSFQICVPPIAEQEKIVAELDCLSGIIEKKKQQLKELDNLAQSIFYEMFGDPVENDKGWEQKTIGSFSKCVAGATPSTKVKEYWGGGTIPWLSSGEVGNGRIYATEKHITQEGYDNASTKLIPPHTVVMALAGQGKTRGTVGVAEIPLCTNQSICSIITNDGVNVDFLYYQLRYLYHELRDISNGDGGRGGLNLKLIQGFKVLVPPLTLQQDFASKIESIENQKELIAKSIKETETLFNSRMDYYFN